VKESSISCRCTYDIGNICNYGGTADTVLNLYKYPDIVSTLAVSKDAAQTALEEMIEDISER